MPSVPGETSRHCRRTAFRTAKPVDGDVRVHHPRGETGMAQLVNTLDAWLTAFFEMLSSWIGGAVKLLEAPAQAIGVPAGVFAAVIFLALLIIAWRSMSRYIM
jgi:hypothetical protein